MLALNLSFCWVSVGFEFVGGLVVVGLESRLLKNADGRNDCDVCDTVVCWELVCDSHVQASFVGNSGRARSGFLVFSVSVRFLSSGHC